MSDKIQEWKGVFWDFQKLDEGALYAKEKNLGLINNQWSIRELIDKHHYNLLLEQNKKLEAELASRPSDVANGWRIERDQLKQELAEAKADINQHENTNDALTNSIKGLQSERDAAVKERDEYKALYESKVQQVMRFSQKTDHALESVKMALEVLENNKFVEMDGESDNNYEVIDVITKLKERHNL